jgi:cardiolipin synthase A/B
VFDSVIAWLSGRVSWIWVEAVAPLGLVIAAIVTAHVLLTKRDVGSSIGWIGLAWLSPVTGGFLYYLLGINRVKRRAQRLADRPPFGADRPTLPPMGGRDDHLAPLERAARRLTGRHVERGNAIAVLHNGDGAYPPMLDAIAAATTSIALSSYILRDDEAGGAFVDALIAAHRRGVAVRVLLDGFGSGYFLSGAYTRLRNNGVTAARFMHSPLPWRMPFLNLRTHKKVLLIDGRIGFTGGMNIAAENVLRTEPRHPVRDTHFRIAGPVVGQLMDAFASDWSFVTDEILDGPLWFPPLESAGDAIARVITSGPDLDLEKIEFLVLEAIACARQSIRLATPYFLPDERLITSLSLAAMRGVAVDVVMPLKSNYRVIDWAARANIGPLLREGGRIWLSGPPFDHSKILVVDGQWCLIGSANFDLRSFRLNFELGMEIYNAALADELEALMLGRRSAKLTQEQLESRMLPIRLRNALARLLMPYL